MKVTIGGIPGSGKSTLAKYIAKTLDYKPYSMGDMKGEIAQKEGVNIDEFMAKYPPEKVHHIVDDFQKKLSRRKGNIVVDGWMSWHFVKPSLKIFLDVDWDTAAQRIFDEKRGGDEPEYESIEDCKKTIKQRYYETRRQTMEEYGDADLDDRNNYDVIIDASHPEEKIQDLVLAKIIDYNQLMHPPTFYLAHPTKSREEVRKWELEFEKRTGIDLINPFFDCSSLETELGDIGEDKYALLGKESGNLFGEDLDYLASKTILGGIFIIDKNYSIGTPAEEMGSKMMGKLSYPIVTNPDRRYLNHPALLFLSDKIFEDPKECEEYLTKNKDSLFGLLERSRKKTINNPTFIKMFDMINKNFIYRT